MTTIRHVRYGELVISMDAPPQLRAEHDAVLSRLSARMSTLHFAHAAVAGFVGLIFLGAAAKLWWDYSEYDPELYVAALVVAVVATLYSAVRSLVGAGLFRAERRELTRLRQLRLQLGIDDPMNLLPH